MNTFAAKERFEIYLCHTLLNVLQISIVGIVFVGYVDDTLFSELVKHVLKI